MQLTLAIYLHLRLCPPKHTDQAFRPAGKVLSDRDGSILHDRLPTPAFALIEQTRLFHLQHHAVFIILQQLLTQMHTLFRRIFVNARTHTHAHTQKHTKVRRK